MLKKISLLVCLKKKKTSIRKRTIDTVSTYQINFLERQLNAIVDNFNDFKAETQPLIE